MSQRPVLFMLHALGGSARAWDGVCESLGDAFETMAIDLPGFGDANASTGLTVSEMVENVIAHIRARKAARWMLIGHSMGGKVASIVASRTLSGEPGLFGLAGIVLLAASPPSPEPMEEDRRQEMIAWAANGPLDAAAARAFVDGNVGSPLPAAADRLALDDLERASPGAWLAWLERGSREDWSGAVGRLDLPALIVVGDKDGDLGEAGQRATNARVYPRALIEVERGAGHLLPFERPRQVADRIEAFWLASAGLGPAVPEAYAHLFASHRVSRRTRAALCVRAVSDDPAYAPRVLTPSRLETLRAVAGHVLPQSGPPIDLAARVDAQLQAGTGDGWRFADLPPDRAAYAAALDSLGGFADLEVSEQAACLARVATSEFTGLGNAAGKPQGTPAVSLSAKQMKCWFEDLRADLVRVWLAHPATMATIGFDGYANGGDGLRKEGFQQLGAGEHEPWEPLMAAPR